VREKEFFHYLTHQDRIRYRIVTRPSAKQLWTYTVQLECLFEDKWHAVIRYDDAHGFAHVDILHPDGSQTKCPLLYQRREQSISDARSDLKGNFERHRERYQKELEGYEQGH
jgi:hypothetical protein